MSTTTKRKRDEDENEGPPNKKIKEMDEEHSISLPMLLVPELWLHILSLISYKYSGSIRLVCRQWNKFILSKDYGKALCVRKFSHNIGPLKITNLASLSKVPDSELVFIPTIQERSKLSVDWIAYHNFRVLLRRSIRSIVEYCCDSGYPLTIQDLLSNSDLTYSIIDKMITVTDNAVMDSGALNKLLLNVIPLVVQYQRIDLASRALSHYLRRDAHYFDSSKSIDQLLDLHDVVSSHFPDHRNKVFEKICNASREFSYSLSTSIEANGQSRSFCERVFPRLLRTIIQQGSKQLDGQNDIPRVSRICEIYFPVIFEKFAANRYVVNELHSSIVSICHKEFELTEDWRVKESALLAASISNCTYADYTYDCVKFAFIVLSDKQNHQQVLQAAAILLCSKLIDSVAKLTPDECDLAFDFLIWTSQFHQAEPKHVSNILNGLTSLLTNPKNVVSDSKLDLFHAALFHIPMIPGIIKKSTPLEVDVIHSCIHQVALAFGERLIKYLRQYREAYIKMARLGVTFLGSQSPPQIVSYYLYIGHLIDPKRFYIEAFGIWKRSQHIHPIAANFGACFPIESLSAPYADPREVIELILSLYPKEVIKPLHKVKEEETETKNNHQADFPDYIPHSKHQYDEAVKQMYNSDPADLCQLFNFSQKPESSTKMTVYQTELVPLESFPKIQVDNRVAMAGVELLVDICMKLATSNDCSKKEILQECAPKILSLIINCLRMDLMIRQKWLSGAKILLQEISVPQLACYLTALLGAWNGKIVNYSFTKLADKLTELQNCIHHTILSKFIDPPVDLLSKYFDMLFCFDTPLHWILRLRALEDIILQWPRTAWTALCNAAVSSGLLVDGYNANETPEDEVGRKLVWRLLMKYYGYNRVAALISRLRRVNVPVGYFYEQVSIYLLWLDTLSDTELQYQATETLPKFAIFCRLYQVDKNAGDVCFFNQFITDQSNIGKILNTINPELVTEELKGNYFSLFF